MTLSNTQNFTKKITWILLASLFIFWLSVHAQIDNNGCVAVGFGIDAALIDAGDNPYYEARMVGG